MRKSSDEKQATLLSFPTEYAVSEIMKIMLVEERNRGVV